MTLFEREAGTSGLDDERWAGLSETDVLEARERFGANTLPSSTASSLPMRILGQIRDPMILLLIGAGAVTTAVGDVVDTLVIALVVVLNSAIGVVQEGRAERSLAALETMAAPRATASRDHVIVVVAASELVPGDVVHLRGGDIVPADLRLFEVHDLQIDEAALTGESIPVSKVAGELALSGTVVTRGRAVGTVCATGEASNLGRIASLVADAPRQMTPLQRRLSQLSKVLVIVAAAISGLVFAVGVAQGRAASEMLVVAVSLAVAAVPESLPAVVSVALALGAYRMARRSAIVRRLPAVETLGSVTVIATDKTGTLTENKMTANLVWVEEGYFSADAEAGYGLEPSGTLHRSRAGVRALLEAAALCNDANIGSAPGQQDAVINGDPLDTALVRLAMRGGVDVERTRARLPRLSEVPFDATTRIMTTRHRIAGDRVLTVVKGAPEQLLAIEGIETLDGAVQASHELADAGLRVIAVAVEIGGGPVASAGRGIRLLGLIAIADRVRASSRAVVQACADAGVRVVMVTGDHPRTAAAVARQVGITARSPAVVVPDGWDPGQISEHVDEVGVFARTLPEQKVEIVRALQARGHVVAMTGDGVNDAPALRSADIGVAMGRRGTEVARQAAELVLADDELGSVVAAIQEGRRISTNIRAFLRYALSGGLAEVIVMLVGPFIGLGVALLPGQILWINLLTHGLPGVAFGGLPADPAAMQQPSKSPDAFILGDGLWRQIAFLGTAIAAVSLIAGAMALQTGADVSTFVFLVLGLSQLAVAMSIRTKPIVTGRRRYLNAFSYAVGGAAVLMLLAVELAPLQRLLRTTDVPLQALVPLVALACVPSMILSFARAVGWPAAGPRSRRLSSLAPQSVAEDSAEAPALKASMGDRRYETTDASIVRSIRGGDEP